MRNWKEKAKQIGFNFTGEPNWDGVETHLRIFGHLPEEGCYRYFCEKILGWEKSNECIENFLDNLLSQNKEGGDKE